MNCLICNNSLKGEIFNKNGHEITGCDCPSCGNYNIKIEAVNILNERKKEKYIIAGHLRNIRKNKDSDIFIIDKEKLEEIFKQPYKKPESVTEQINRLLFYLEEKSIYAGAEVPCSCLKEYPIFYCKSQNELKELYNMLEEMSFVKSVKNTRNKDWGGSVQLLYKGYQKIEELKTTVKQSNKCFVAMPFKKTGVTHDDLEEIENLYKNCIVAVLKQEGYKDPFRVDEDKKTDYITNKIIANIRQSSLIIVEATPLELDSNNGIYPHNANVYYEAGFARGLAIPTIWLCRGDKVGNGKLPFDTSGIMHLTWEPGKEEEFKKKLKECIEANVKNVK